MLLKFTKMLVVFVFLQQVDMGFTHKPGISRNIGTVFPVIHKRFINIINFTNSGNSQPHIIIFNRAGFMLLLTA